MICQYSLRALLRGNVRKSFVGGRLLTTGNMVRSEGHPHKYETLLQTLSCRNVGDILLRRRISCVAGIWVGAPHTQKPPKGVLVVPHRSAGHSKWQNIKHTKEANDRARGIAFSKIALRIKIAIQMGKSSDPKLNSQLASVVEEAKRLNMPGSKIEGIIKHCEGKDANLISFTMEAKGPGGTFFIIELLTDSLKKTQYNLKYLLTKLGVNFVDGIKFMFKYKGVVTVDPEPSNLTLEKAVDIAIEAGAEDVVEAIDNDGTSVLQFLCEPKEITLVKTALSDRGYSLKSWKASYIPEQKIQLNDEHLDVMSKIVDVLDSHPDVDRFYYNVE